MRSDNVIEGRFILCQNVKQCIRAGGGGKTRFAGGVWPAFWSDTLLLD